MANRATVLIVLILIAACGYNWLQIRALQGQIAGLRNQLPATKHTPSGTELPGEPNNTFAAEDAHVAILINRAGEHYAAYKKDVSQSDLVDAAKELEAYIADRRAALKIQQSEAEQSVSTLKRLIGSVSNETGLGSSSSQTPPQTGSGI